MTFRQNHAPFPMHSRPADGEIVMHKSPMRLPLLALVVVTASALAPAAAGASTPATPPRPTADAALVRALQDHVWTLNAATDAAGTPVDALLVPGPPFVMRFDGTRAAVQGGCNLWSSAWRLSPQNSLTFGRAVTTRKACEQSLMAADSAMAAALAAPLQARVEGGAEPVLQLVSKERQTLTFSGRRTSKSLYGAPKRIFLEVAAQRTPCTPALQPPTTCLQVRELRFDDKGLRVGEPGPWRAFYSEIAGYTHEPGVSNVLRINRFKRPQAPADASAYVYELDLVVESRVDGKP
jgi:heat shock protein HslJ